MLSADLSNNRSNLKASTALLWKFITAPPTQKPFLNVPLNTPKTSPNLTRKPPKHLKSPST